MRERPLHILLTEEELHDILSSHTLDAGHCSCGAHVQDIDSYVIHLIALAKAATLANFNEWMIRPWPGK